MLQTTQEPTPKRVATTKIWYCRAAKVVGTQHQQNSKTLYVRKPEQCKYERIYKFLRRGFLRIPAKYPQHAEGSCVRCELYTDAYKVSFNAILTL